MKEKYIASKKLAWSETTLKSVTSFLNQFAHLVEKGDPKAFYDGLMSLGKGRYSIQTYFIHASNYYEWLHPNKINVFKQFRKEQRNAFKNAYKTKEVGITYEELLEKLEKEPDCEEKTAVLYLLKTAQRCSEAGFLRTQEASINHKPESYIVGKGGKIRPNFGEAIERGTSDYYSLYSYTRRFGLTPHALRKLALTHAARNGAQAADLCSIAGWSSIQTAIRYLQPQDTERLTSFLD